MSQQSSPPEENVGDAILHQLVEDLTKRLQEGDNVDLDAVVAEHPAFAEHLRDIWPMLTMMSKLGPSPVNKALNSDEDEELAQVGAHQVLGDFRLVREIARGGMGIVFEAERIPDGQRVALKLLPFTTLYTQRQIQRFLNESQAASSLAHPHIVPVLAVGCQRGLHYYVMKYIEGQSLESVISGFRAGQLAIQSSLPKASYQTMADWIAQAAEALDYAHSVGVLHRDVKPSNLLLDTHGKIWVTDFGLAQTDSGENLTRTGDVLGTLQYMSPEQAMGIRGIVDRRTDVYSLGATLYELLTGAPMWKSSDRHTLLTSIQFEDPPWPRKHNPEIPAPVEAIVLKATAKEPTSRYLSAYDFAKDLQRFVENRPITVRLPSWKSRIRNWTRRNRTLTRSLTVAAGISFVSLLVAFVIIWLALGEATRQRNLAQQSTSEARAAAKKAQAATEAVRQSESIASQFLYAADMQLAELAQRRGEIGYAQNRLAAHVPSGNQTDNRGFEWYHLKSHCQDKFSILQRHSRDIFGMAYSNDGRYFATSSRDRSVIISDSRTGETVQTLREFSDDVNGVTFSPDGSLLATAEENCLARVWDWKSGVEVARFADFTQPVAQVFITADARHLIVTQVKWGTHAEGRIAVFDLRTRELLHSVDGYRALAVHHASKRIVGCNEHGHLALWSLPELKPITNWQGSHRLVYCGAFSPDGNLLVTGGTGNGGIYVYSLDDPQNSVRTYTSDGISIRSLAFTPKGDLIVSVNDHGIGQFWDTTNFDLKKIFAPTQRLWSVAIQPDGERFVVGRDDGAVQIREFSSLHLSRRSVFDDGIALRGIVFEPSGQRFAVIPRESTSISICDSRTGKPIRSITNSEPGVFTTAQFGNDGSTIWLADGGAVLQRFDVGSGRLLASHHPMHADVLKLMVSPDCTYVGAEYWLSPTQRRLSVWNAGFAKPGFSTNDLTIGDIVFLSEQAIVAQSLRVEDCHSLYFLDIQSGILSQKFKHPSMIDGLTVSRDARTLVTLCRDSVIRVWDTESGELRSSVRGNFPFANHVAISPDGKTLATAIDNGPLVLWHFPTQQALYSLGTCPGKVNQMIFSDDGRRLLMALDNTKVIAWEASQSE